MDGLAGHSGSASVLLLGAAHDRMRLRDTAAAVGAAIAGEHDWGSAFDPPQPMPALVLAAVDAVPPTALTAVLDMLGHMASATTGGVVVTLRTDQIDPVAAILLDANAVLLCDPDGPTLVASVALALARSGAPVTRAVRETEAERLQRLNEEIARIAEVLARLARQEERRSGGVADRGRGYHGAPQSVPVAAADVRKAIRARRLRDQLFTDGLFEDPAWDMLLDLYAAELEYGQVSVSSLCIAAAVPPTTALRWIGRMTDSGLLERRPDDLDRRRAFIGLTRPAREKMDGYFALLAQNGIVIA